MRQEPAAFSAEQAHEYSESMGQIGAGLWRQLAWAERNRIPDALGMTMREWVERYVGNYVRLSVAERREAVAELAAEGMSQRDIADVVGVGEATVNRDLKAVAAAATPVPNGTRSADEPAPDVGAVPAAVPNETPPSPPDTAEPTSTPDVPPALRPSPEDTPNLDDPIELDKAMRQANPEGYAEVVRAHQRKMWSKLVLAISQAMTDGGAEDYGIALEPRDVSDFIDRQLPWLQEVIEAASARAPRIVSLNGRKG